MTSLKAALGLATGTIIFISACSGGGNSAPPSLLGSWQSSCTAEVSPSGTRYVTFNDDGTYIWRTSVYSAANCSGDVLFSVSELGAYQVQGKNEDNESLLNLSVSAVTSNSSIADLDLSVYQQPAYTIYKFSGASLMFGATNRFETGKSENTRPGTLSSTVYVTTTKAPDVGSSGDDDDDTSLTLAGIKGDYSSPCLAVGSKSMNISPIFGSDAEDAYQVETKYFSSADCDSQTVTKKAVEVGTISLGTTADANGAFEIDRTMTKLTIYAYDADKVSSYKDDAKCGATDWVVGEAKEITTTTDVDCLSEFTVGFYGVIKKSDDGLLLPDYVGAMNGNGWTKEDRYTTVGSSVYTK